MEHSLYDVDKEARFQKVYDSYMQDVYRLCFSYMKNKMDTEDAVQETFCRFYQAMESVKEEEHVKGWLLVTAGNVCKNILKHWWRKNRSWQENEETKGRYDEYEIEMLELVLNLPVKYKTVVYLYYYEGCNSVQIAKLLKKPESTIRTHLQKAKKLLKQELNEGNAVGVNRGSVYQTRERSLRCACLLVERRPMQRFICSRQMRQQSRWKMINWQRNLPDYRSRS